VNSWRQSKKAVGHERERSISITRRSFAILKVVALQHTGLESMTSTRHLMTRLIPTYDDSPRESDNRGYQKVPEKGIRRATERGVFRGLLTRPDRPYHDYIRPSLAFRIEPNSMWRTLQSCIRSFLQLIGISLYSLAQTIHTLR
jgi:hypothetical protein